MADGQETRADILSDYEKHPLDFLMDDAIQDNESLSGTLPST